ncbi:hypothetical protein MLD38_021286 [Melastoma candidum]|uniref:Uncharacterized protein n=1 Tax=Melastoma candidum TaxID=119954 RepID=A0ACB9QFP7_9MYRT|nr:hypothetical protein MLD38_021286 [Melastoma candidum]
MSRGMNLSINGQSQVPPGFRFHPTEEELLHYYLRKKVACEKIDLDVIREVDLNKLEPWDIQEMCRIGSTPQTDWYFFSHKDRKYPTGTRMNRATTAGFWKATGRDKIIRSGSRRIGLRKTLVFYKGRAPHGQKSDWIMHEYRLDDGAASNNEIIGVCPAGDAMSEEGWVVCRVFKKKNYVKTLDSPQSPSGSLAEARLHSLSGGNSAILNQILSYMGRTCESKSDLLDKLNVVVSDGANLNKLSYQTKDNLSSRFTHLPRLGSSLGPNDHSNIKPSCYQYQPFDDVFLRADESPAFQVNQHGMIRDWATLDRLVASQLNGQAEVSLQKQQSYFVDDPSMSTSLPPHDDEKVPFPSQKRLTRPESHHDRDHDHQQNLHMYGCDNDFWGITTSTSPSSLSDGPLRYLSA